MPTPTPPTTTHHPTTPTKTQLPSQGASDKPVLQIPVRASRHGPLADFFQQTGPVLVREAVQKWAFLEQNNAKFQN